MTRESICLFLPFLPARVQRVYCSRMLRFCSVMDGKRLLCFRSRCLLKRPGVSLSVLLTLLFLPPLRSAVVFSDDLTVFKREVGSYVTTEQTLYMPGNKTRDGLHKRDITHRLVLIVTLVPAQAVVDVYSIEPLNETDKKAARGSVEKCLLADAVRKPLNSIVTGFRNRIDVPMEINNQFHQAFFQCLEPSRHEQLNYATEFQTEKTVGEWKSEQPHPIYPRINGFR